MTKEGRIKRELAKKYGKAEKSKGIQAEEKQIQKTKQTYHLDQAEIEKNLTEFLAQKDPLMWEGKAIALIKRPSMKELKKLIPPEMRKYVDNPEALPEKLGKKYEKFFYKKMSEFIVVPKKTPEEWEAMTNPWLIRLFWMHFASIARLMEGQIEGF